MYGSHLSVAGGMHNALTRAHELGMGCVQVFTKNQQTWNAPPLADAVIAEWDETRTKLGSGPVVSHGSYLINLASPDDTLWRKSIDLYFEEIRRCDALGIPHLVTHPGAHVGSGEEAGVKRVAAALDVIHATLPKSKTITCLEVTAGQGSCLGHRLEHLAEIIDATNKPERVAVCLDTAHLFAAGYDFRGRKYAAFKKELDKTVGLDRVKVWHLNDSKKPLGSRVDRHEHIGRGEIGEDGFRPIVRDKLWKDVPKVLETAKEESPDGRPWDAVNLETLHNLQT